MLPTITRIQPYQKSDEPLKRIKLNIKIDLSFHFNQVPTSQNWKEKSYTNFIPTLPNSYFIFHSQEIDHKSHKTYAYAHDSSAKEKTSITSSLELKTLTHNKWKAMK